MKVFSIQEIVPTDIQKQLSRSKKWEIHTNHTIRQTWEILDTNFPISQEVSVKQSGEPLFLLKISSFFGDDIYTVAAPIAGIYSITPSGWIGFSMSRNIIIRQFDNEQEFGDFYISEYYLCHPIVDEFDESIEIEWVEKRTSLSIYGINLSSNVIFGIEANNIGVFLKLVWSSYGREDIDISMGGTLTLLFSNHEKRTLTANGRPLIVPNTKSTVQLLFPLDLENLYLLSSYHIVAWKFESSSSDTPFICGREKYNMYTAAIFCAYIRKNMEMFTCYGYQPESSQNFDDSKRNNTKQCYVYLMHDLANGYYKIGISNNPEYRERTLQSEKPTIELIIAKEFPIRRLAEAFEAALHKTYESKRLRGEWFRLDSNDVEDLKNALS